MSNFFNELKNRNVYKAATAYVVTGWLILQVVEIFSEFLQLPNSFGYWVTMILIVGFPIVLLLTWVYEITPKGLKRTGAVQEDTPENRRSGKRLNHIIIGALSLIICLMLVERVFFAGNLSMNKRQLASIAVLPFDNISLTGGDVGFSRGLTEQISNDLASVGGLKVIDPNSSFSFEGQNLSDREIAEELKVEYLLKGSLQYDDGRNRIKIITRLVHASSGSYEWSNSYEDDFEEIFMIQEDVSRNVVSKLRVTLSPQEDKALSTKPTENTDAYKLYLESKNYSKKRTDEDLRKAIDLLKEAVANDPDFAEAHAELSYLYNNLSFYGNLSKEVKDERRAYHIKRALDIAPDKPEVLWAKASYNNSNRKDSSQVIADLRRAIALKPNYADAYYVLGMALQRVRATDQALESFEEAVNLDPENEFLKVQLADWYYIYGYRDQGMALMNDLVVKDSSTRAMDRLALMQAKGPEGDMVQAFKLIYQSSKREGPRGNLSYPLLFSMDLDLLPVSEKYARLLEMRYPDNHNTFWNLFRLYSFKKEYSVLEEVLDFWASEKGLDEKDVADVKTAIHIENKNFKEAQELYEKTFPDILETEFTVDKVDFNYNKWWNYIEILRLNKHDKRAESLAKIFCDFYNIKSGEDEYYPAFNLNRLELDCHYLANDTLAFVRALEEQFFDKKDRLDIFSDMKCGVYERFYWNKEFQEVFQRITEETHRMRAEVIKYLKEEGDWDPAWDKELGLD
jgi:TolB-like protein